MARGEPAVEKTTNARHSTAAMNVGIAVIVGAGVGIVLGELIGSMLLGVLLGSALGIVAGTAHETGFGRTRR